MIQLKRVVAFALALSLGAALAWAAAPKTYQVTGPILELTDDMIVVQKGQDKWQIARDGSTKVTGELKVGAKVTIEYRMTATSIEVKAATAPKKAASK
jgi:RNase P/RNase MRP subunit p29